MKNLLKIGLLCCLPFWVVAQDGEVMPDDEETVIEIPETEIHPIDPVVSTEQVPLREIPAGAWQKATNGLDYSKDMPEKPKDIPTPPTSIPRPDWNPDWEGWGNALQVLAIILAVLGIGWGIYKALDAQQDHQIARDGTTITLENLEEYLQESDLDRFLREALAANNFALAVRLYYLQVIKNLAHKNAIRWSREKTNRDYLLEMRSHPLAHSFRDATRTYERVWYGNANLAEAEFMALQPELKKIVEATQI